jgi:hypothetical protein
MNRGKLIEVCSICGNTYYMSLRGMHVQSEMQKMREHSSFFVEPYEGIVEKIRKKCHLERANESA